MSGHAPTERAELAVRKGLTWLGKPYGMDTLAQTVERVLRDDAGRALGDGGGRRAAHGRTRRQRLIGAGPDRPPSFVVYGAYVGGCRRARRVSLELRKKDVGLVAKEVNIFSMLAVGVGWVSRAGLLAGIAALLFVAVG